MLRGGSRGRVQGVCTPPPPWDDLWFSNTTGILPKKKPKWFIGVEVEQETSAPPPKKILDPPLMLIGLSPWTGWYSIFWWPLITTPLGRETGVCHILNPSAYGFAQKSSGIEITVCQRWPTPGWYGFAHALETGQAVGWCTCANCRYVCYNATRYLLTFSTNGVVQEP